MNKLNANDIQESLDGNFDYNVKVFAETGSTNDDAKTAVQLGAREGLVLVAERQDAGRGRLDRNFFSPAYTGVYFSAVYKPEKAFTLVEYMTVFAALAVSDAIEKLFAVKAEIKWVNDVFVGGKKCAGILTEAVTDEEGRLTAVVVGIGVNIKTPEAGFPQSIRATAGAVTEKGEDKRAELVAEILNNLAAEYVKFDVHAATDRYREKSNLIGKRITVTQADREYEATVLDIDNACRLIVKRDDGVTAALNYGDVKMKNQ